MMQIEAAALYHSGSAAVCDASADAQAMNLDESNSNSRITPDSPTGMSSKKRSGQRGEAADRTADDCYHNSLLIILRERVE
eukprot:scaffold20745_cov39-Attheya_sp.AAC.3